jgi:thymidylate synthase ThyX
MSESFDAISQYVTNTDKSVYCLKNLPPEVCAVLFAYVSRSPRSFRENLQSLLSDGELNVLGKIEDNSGFNEKKAARFHKKWVLKYGHSSVAEHADLHIAVEDISFLAAKAIEDNRLAAFTEKSSRYQIFEQDSFHWPAEIKSPSLLSEGRELIADIYQGYADLYKPVYDELEKSNMRPESISVKAWENTLFAAACDTIRYLLPSGTKTSMGVSINARSAAHMIRKLRNSGIEELVRIGDSIASEGTQITPALLKYSEPTDWMKNVNSRIKSSIDRFCLEEDQEKFVSRVRLVECDRNAVEKLCADLIYCNGRISLPASREVVRVLSDAEKKSLLESAINDLGPFDWFPRIFEQIYVTVEFCTDYGAFRDLQRHRMATQSNPILGCDFGYETPSALGKIPQIKMYHELMERAREFWTKARIENPEAAQYFIPLAFRKSYVLKMNLRECEHFIRLRSSKAGHESYRSAAIDLYNLLAKEYPLLISWFRVDSENYDLSRTEAEQKYE